MSYNCDLEIPIRGVPSNKQRTELFNILTNHRPENTGLIDCDDMVIQFPFNFRSDPTGDVTDFMKKHQLTLTINFIDDSGDTSYLEYINGVLQDDD